VSPIRLTRSGATTLAAVAVCALAGRLFGLVEGFVAAVAMLLIVGLAAISAGRRPLDIEVERRVRPTRVPIDAAIRVDVTLRNTSRARSGVVSVVDRVSSGRDVSLQLAPLPGGASRQIVYRIPAGRRGIVTIGPVEVRTGDPLGLFTRRRVVDSRCDVIVLPRVIPLPPLPAARGDDPDTDGRQRRTLANSTNEFSSLRDYLPGDDVRRVHWPSTARRGVPMVRQFDEPWQRRVTVVVDLRSSRHDGPSFERAMTAAASVIESCAGSDQLVRLVTTSGDDTGFISSRQDLDAAIDILATAVPSSAGSLGGIHTSLIARRSGGAVVTIAPALPDSERAIITAMAARFGLAVAISCAEDDLAESWDRSITARGAATTATQP